MVGRALECRELGAAFAAGLKLPGRRKHFCVGFGLNSRLFLSMDGGAGDASSSAAEKPQQGDPMAGPTSSLQGSRDSNPIEGSKVVDKVDILIRGISPGDSKDVKVTLAVTTTVDGLKKIVQEHHTNKPSPDEQTLIHAGKVLRDGAATIGEIVKHGVHGQTGPFSFHLVVKGKDASPTIPGKLPSRKVLDEPRGGGSMGGGAGPSGADSSYRAPSQRFEGQLPPGGQPLEQQSTSPAQNVAMMPSGAVAVPYMVVNPVVSAAYGAAFAAVNPNGSNSHANGANTPQGTSMLPMPFMTPPWTVPGQLPQPAPASTSTSSSDPTLLPTQQNGGTNISQPAFPPLIPAIAFFPLGVPMLVPATAPPHGFQVHPQMTTQMQNQGGNIFPGQMPIPAQPLRQPNLHGHHHHHHHPPGVQVPRRRRRRVVMYRISIRAVLQLILMFTLLYAYTPRGRFTLLVGLFCVFYIAARPLRRMLEHLTRGGNMRPGHPGHPGQPGQPPQPRGIIHEVLTLVLGFVTSVFPAWNINVQDEAEFAAAQEIVNREERERERERERAQNQQQDRAHNAERVEQHGVVHFHQD